MSSKGKKAASKSNKKKGGKTKGESKSKSKSKRSGLAFPVGRIQRYLRKRRVASRVGVDSAVYLAAVMEYLTAEVLELSGNTSKDLKRKRITPRHMLLAVRNDEELDNLVGKSTVLTEGGKFPFIHSKLQPKKDEKGGSKKKRKSTKKPKGKPKGEKTAKEKKISTGEKVETNDEYTDPEDNNYEDPGSPPASDDEDSASESDEDKKRAKPRVTALSLFKEAWRKDSPIKLSEEEYAAYATKKWRAMNPDEKLPWFNAAKGQGATSSPRTSTRRQSKKSQSN